MRSITWAGSGGNALLQKRFKGGMVERASDLMRKYGAMALIVPALLPPPAPFKIFVLLGGVANIPLKTFIVSIAVGRGVRYFGEGILAVLYGKQALDYIHENSRTVGLVLGLSCSPPASRTTSGKRTQPT